jgi:RimJ/RimL family protein N-acetyltransferase
VTLQLAPLAPGEDVDVLANRLALGFGGDTAAPREMIEQTFAMLEAYPRSARWGSYLAYDGETPVGTCAFKTAPNAEGAVEIAYFTFPAFEGRGFATTMAAA